MHAVQFRNCQSLIKTRKINHHNSVKEFQLAFQQTELFFRIGLHFPESGSGKIPQIRTIYNLSVNTETI